MAQILYGLQPHSEKPLMMWLFETHAASQHLPLRKLDAIYDGEPSESCEKSV